ncbi:MAG: Mur ligase family protein [Candidatus Komeilibacteria bacterium]|nr:Mur ligase family protein [Candidatus Komeilibacteria bacterium]
MTFADYHQAVNFLESLLNLPIPDYLLKTTDRSIYLKRLERFLAILGNPEKNMKFIHITGTAGKGTTVNCLHQIIQAGGKKVGSYYSPHPTTALERIKVNDLYISPADFSRLTEKIKTALDTTLAKSPFGQPSYFETFLALALLYFKEQKCDYVILEAGLGGTHDATNVIAKPLITAITNIDYDHTEILGKTLSKIAKDKAGIIKRGCQFFTTETKEAQIKIFQAKCDSLGVKYHLVPAKDADINPNLALAQAIADQLGFSQHVIAQGLKSAKLPCRSEVIQTRPLVIIDGSHNPIKLKFLAKKIHSLYPDKKVNLILGMAADKNLEDSLKEILPAVERAIFTRFLMPYRRSADITELARISKKIKPIAPVKVFTDPWQALDYGLKMTKKNELLLITGSFFLAGELRTRWITEEQILKTRSSFL